MDVFPIDWRATERDTSFEITCFGKLRDGRSACMRVPFFPYFFVECPAGWQASRAKLFIAEAVSTLGAVPKYSLPVARKSIWGFANNQPRTFAQLAFYTLAAFRRARWAIADRHKLKTYEASVDQVLRLFHVRNLAPAQWVRVAAWKEVAADRRVAVTDLEITVEFTALAPSLLDAIPPIVFASWDIECYSESGAFPLAEKQGDVICTIGTTFQRYGEAEPYLRQAVTLGGCDPLAGVEVVPCETEADLISAWLDTLRREGVDVLCGWNTFQFDYKYLYGRSLVCVDDLTGEPLVQMGLLGKAVEGGGVPVQKNLSSAAYGDNAFFYMASPGIINLDLMQSIKREHKFDSYSLNAVSAKILGDAKIDLKPAEIFAKCRGSDADRAVVAEYCVKDTLLPLQLMATLSIFQNMMEMANATAVPLTYLVERGQQIKVYSLIVRKARSLGYVCPDMDRGAAAADAEKYEGATVLDACKGAYLTDVVSALDFASLYPSIIRAHNLCPSTLVMDPAYDAVEGVRYYTIATPLGTFRFAQDVPSVVPALLSDLALFRADAKKQMAIARAAGDSFRASVENSKQLAYKVSMNSAYGFFGAQKGGLLPCIPVAIAVTTTGRHMIAATKAMVEQLVPGSRVVYGDSVSGATPVWVRARGVVRLVAIEDLVGGDAVPWRRMQQCGKEYVDLEGVETFTDAGWTPVECIIRHALAPTKDMVRVLTTAGVVDVTTDHSLLRADGTPVSPRNARLGMDLLVYDGQSPLLGGQVADALHHEVVRRDLEHGPLSLDDQLRAARLMAYAHLWGLSVGVDVGTQTLCTDARPTGRLARMIALPHPGPVFVYDVTTANHRFAAGVGRLVVHNTDSVMCIFNCGPENRTNVHAHFEVAQRVAKQITETFTRPNELEFEKCYFPYLLFSKKRYAGMLYTAPDAPDAMDVKGLQLVRRDNAPIVKTVSSDILESIMRDKSRDLAVDVAKRHVLMLLANRHALESYITSKALRSEYKNPSSQPHLQVALKIHQRRGYPVPSGERVPYVFVESEDAPDGLQAQRAEDPCWVAEHGLVIDRLHYLDSQLAGPIETLLDVLQPGAFAELMASPDVKPLVDELRGVRADAIAKARRVRTNTANKQREITSYFIR